MSKLGSEAAWVFAGQLLSLAGTLIGVRILTEYLSPNAYGSLGLSLTIAALFTEVVIGGLVGAFTRFYSIADAAGDILGYVRAIRRLLLFAAAIAAAMLLTTVPLLLNGFEGLTIQTGLVVTLFAVLFGSSAALNAAFNGARLRKLVALNSVIDAWLKIGLAILAIHLFGPDPIAVLTGYAMSLVFILLHQAYRMKQLTAAGAAIGRRNWSKEMLLFAWPASVWGVFTWAQLVADRWSLQVFYSSFEVGVYSVVLQLGYFPMTLLMGMLGTFLTPIFFQKTDDQDLNISQEQNAWWHTVLLLGTGFSVVAAGVAYLLKDWVFTLLVSDQYWLVRGYLPIMVLSGGLFGTGSLMSVRLMSHMKMVELAKIMIGTAVFGVLLTFWLTSTYGLTGTVVAKLLFAISYIGWMVWATIFYRKH